MRNQKLSGKFKKWIGPVLGLMTLTTITMPIITSCGDDSNTSQAAQAAFDGDTVDITLSPQIINNKIDHFYTVTSKSKSRSSELFSLMNISPTYLKSYFSVDQWYSKGSGSGNGNEIKGVNSTFTDQVQYHKSPNSDEIHAESIKSMHDLKVYEPNLFDEVLRRINLAIEVDFWSYGSGSDLGTFKQTVTLYKDINIFDYVNTSVTPSTTAGSSDKPTAIANLSINNVSFFNNKSSKLSYNPAWCEMLQDYGQNPKIYTLQVSELYVPKILRFKFDIPPSTNITTAGSSYRVNFINHGSKKIELEIPKQAQTH